VLGVGSAFEDAVVDEPVEAVGEHVPSQSDAALEIFEPACAVERLAEDHPDPALAHDAR